MNNTAINEYTGMHQIACLDLTCCPTLGILRLLLPNMNEKETYGNGAGQRVIPLYWMDFAHTQTPQRYTVHICGPSSGGWSKRSLLCSLVKSRADERRASKRKAGFAQKIKPPERWQTKQFTAVRLLHRFPRPSRSSPSIDLPTFSITRCPRTSQWLYKMWAHERRCAHE